MILGIILIALGLVVMIGSWIVGFNMDWEGTAGTTIMGLGAIIGWVAIVLGIISVILSFFGVKVVIQ